MKRWTFDTILAHKLRQLFLSSTAVPVDIHTDTYKHMNAVTQRQTWHPEPIRPAINHDGYWNVSPSEDSLGVLEDITLNSWPWTWYWKWNLWP